MTWKSVWPSKDLPPQTITGLGRQMLDDFTGSIMLLTCAQCEPALICERTGCHCQTFQLWCSVANANRAAPCWAVSTGPIRGSRALLPPSWSLFLTVWSETCTPVACRRTFCGALAVLLLFLLAQRSRYRSCCWVDALLQLSPALLV